MLVLKLSSFLVLLDSSQAEFLMAGLAAGLGYLNLMTRERRTYNTSEVVFWSIVEAKASD